MNKPSEETPEFAIVSGSFVIAGFSGDPADITRALSITPDEFGRAGETRRLSGAQREYRVPSSYWELHAGKRRAPALEDCIEEILVRIEPAATALKRLPPKLTKKVLIQVSIDADGRAPGMLLSKELLARLAKLGVALEIDVN